MSASAYACVYCGGPTGKFLEECDPCREKAIRLAALAAANRGETLTPVVPPAFRTTCLCVCTNTRRPDPTCDECKGSGEIVVPW